MNNRALPRVQVTEDQLKVLMGSLNRNRVKSRRQGGASLSYLEAWDVKATLIRLFGYLGFSSDVVESSILHAAQSHKVIKKQGQPTTFAYEAVLDPTKPGDDGKPLTIQVPIMQWDIAATATVRLTIHGEYGDVTYTETAVASQKGPDYGDVADFAMKTAESDALKRCAINLGTQFGLSLYDDGSTTDVVRVIFEPGQSEMLKQIEESKVQRDAAQALQAQARAGGDPLPDGPVHGGPEAQ